MNVLRTESTEWLSNAYLIDDGAGTGVLIDGNGVATPLLEAAAERDLRIAAVLLTHHHPDHIVLDAYQALDAPVYAHPLTAGELAGVVDEELTDGQVSDFGGLSVEALHTPGHAHGHLSFLVNGSDVFTGDVLFQGTVGGTRGPKGTGLADLRQSLQRLLALPPETRVRPGHREPTTVGEELETNPFVRALFADQEPEGVPCIVAGEPARLLLWGPDYDGTNKAWVRFDASGEEATIGGSQVVRGRTDSDPE
jgi:glyoxylase-like metal-dependent hydrolase (beta-lactamase superfamily II)